MMEKNLFNDLIDSAHEMVAIEKNLVVPEPQNVHRYELPDVRAIRHQAGMKQQEFAEAIGLSVDLIRSWEQKRRIPSGIALKVLFMLEKDPNMINTFRTTHI